MVVFPGVAKYVGVGVGRGVRSMVGVDVARGEGRTTEAVPSGRVAVGCDLGMTVPEGVDSG